MPAPKFVERSWLWIPLLAFVMFAGWAFVSPPGSSPDDDYHLTSIWCVEDGQGDRCTFLGDEFRSVPRAVVDAGSCYAFKPEVSGACFSEISRGLTLTDRANDVQELYPTLFYRTMGVMVGTDIERSVLAMRLFNSFIAAGLLGFVLALAPLGIRSAVLVTTVVGYIPLGLSIIPSTNPSSWTVTGIVMFTAFGLTLIHQTYWKRWRTLLVAALTIVSAALAIGSRVDGMTYVVIVSIAIGLYSGYRQLRAAWIASLILVAVSVIAIWNFFTFSTPGGAEPMGEQARSVGLLTTNLLSLPVLIQGAVGGWDLGWNDTPMPPLVPIIGMVALGALAYRGLLSVSWRKAFAVAFSSGMVVAVPLAFLQKEGLGVGEIVQPRYILPLLLFALIMLSLGNTVNDALPLSVPAGVALWLALGTSASLAFWAYAHRYAVGTDTTLLVLDIPIEWVNSAGIPFGLIAGTTIAASFMFIGGALAVTRGFGNGAGTARIGRDQPLRK
jgi:hypothetical protein